MFAIHFGLVLCLVHASEGLLHGLERYQRIERQQCMKLEISIEDEIVTIEMKEEAEAYSLAERMHTEGKLTEEESKALADGLIARWRASREERRAYIGPEPKNGVLQNVQAQIVLEEAGIILEVADSTIHEGGRGLYVRKIRESPFLFKQGDVVCGYAFGCTDHGLSRAEAKSNGAAVTMAFTSKEQRVFYDGHLCTVGSLLDEGYAAASIPALFLPDIPQPPLTIMNIGQIANDLAWSPSVSEESYTSKSANLNILALVGRLEATSTSPPRILSFSRPIVVARSDTLIANDLPMELGVEYGWNYWTDADQQHNSLSSPTSTP